jgi:ankyrin repeat protein
MAVWRLSLDHLKSPLSKGKVSSKDLEMKNDLGQTPIYLAIENPEAYAVLGYIFNNYKIEKINVLTENMVSYLHKAVKEADPNVVQFFLEKGVDSSLTNKFGNTALDDTVLMNKPTLGNLIKNWKPSRD